MAEDWPRGRPAPPCRSAQAADPNDRRVGSQARSGNGRSATETPAPVAAASAAGRIPDRRSIPVPHSSLSVSQGQCSDWPFVTDRPSEFGPLTVFRTPSRSLRGANGHEGPLSRRVPARRGSLHAAERGTQPHLPQTFLCSRPCRGPSDVASSVWRHFLKDGNLQPRAGASVVLLDLGLNRPVLPHCQQPLLGFGTHNGSKVPLSLLGWVLMIAGYEDAPPAPALDVGG